MGIFAEEIEDDGLNTIGKDFDWDKTLRTLDLDGDGKINYNEFISAFIEEKKILNDKNIELAFNTLDRHQSGFIEVSVLMEIFGKDDEDDSMKKAMKGEQSAIDALTQSFNSFDKDGDGKISIDEFKDSIHLIWKDIFNE